MSTLKSLIDKQNYSPSEISSSEPSGEISTPSLMYLFLFSSLTIYLLFSKDNCGENFLPLLQRESINITAKRVQ